MYVLYIERSGTRILKSDASSAARERDSHKKKLSVYAVFRCFAFLKLKMIINKVKLLGTRILRKTKSINRFRQRKNLNPHPLLSNHF